MDVVDLVNGRCGPEKERQRFRAERPLRREIADQALTGFAAHAMDRRVQVIGEAETRAILDRSR